MLNMKGRQGLVRAAIFARNIPTQNEIVSNSKAEGSCRQSQANQLRPPAWPTSSSRAGGAMRSGVLGGCASWSPVKVRDCPEAPWVALNPPPGAYGADERRWKLVELACPYLLSKSPFWPRPPISPPPTADASVPGPDEWRGLALWSTRVRLVREACKRAQQSPRGATYLVLVYSEE